MVCHTKLFKTSFAHRVLFCLQKPRIYSCNYLNKSRIIYNIIKLKYIDTISIWLLIQTFDETENSTNILNTGYARTHTLARGCTRTQMHTQSHTQICVYVFAHTHVYTHACTYTHVHTHTRTNSHSLILSHPHTFVL